MKISNTLKTELLLSHMGLTKDDFKLEWIRSVSTLTRIGLRAGNLRA